MSTNIIDSLPKLPRDTNVRISAPGFYRAAAINESLRFELRTNGRNRFNIRNLTSVRKIRTFRRNDPFLRGVNDALGPGESHPVLIAAIGIAGGVATFGLAPIAAAVAVGGATAWTAATACIDANTRDSNFRARIGDELWTVEQIGKYPEGAKYVAMHVTYLFLVDPFRTKGNFREKGWLMHEIRQKIQIDKGL